MTAADGVGTAQIGELHGRFSERIVRYRFDELKVLYCNRAWALALGAEPDAFIGCPLDTLLSPGEREGLVRQLARLGPEVPFRQDHLTRTGADRRTEWTDLYLPCLRWRPHARGGS